MVTINIQRFLHYSIIIFIIISITNLYVSRVYIINIEYWRCDRLEQMIQVKLQNIKD